MNIKETLNKLAKIAQDSYSEYNNSEDDKELFRNWQIAQNDLNQFVSHLVKNKIKPEIS